MLLALRFAVSALLLLLLLRGLLRLKERQILCVAFLFQLIHWNKAQRGGVHAEALSGGSRAIVKQVAQVRIARFGAYLSPLHAV